MANIFNIIQEIKILAELKYEKINSNLTEDERNLEEICFKNLEDLVSNLCSCETIEFLDDLDNDIDEQEQICRFDLNEFYLLSYSFRQ